MSDDGNGKGKKGLHLSKLTEINEQIDEQYRSAVERMAQDFEAVNPHLKAMQDAFHDISGASEIVEAAKAFSDPIQKERELVAEYINGVNSPTAKIAEELAKVSAPAQKAIEQIRASGVYDRLDKLTASAGKGSELEKLAKSIERQQQAIDAMSMPEIDIKPLPSLEHLKIPENPLVETNKRLSRIEDQFEHISDIAKESAQVATGLQTYAAEFLQKFEKAADDTNKSGNKAIVVAVIAVSITLWQAVSPFILPNGDAEALQSAVVDLQGEIATLRADQAEANRLLIEALTSSDQAAAEGNSRLIEALEASDQATAEAVRKALSELVPAAESAMVE